MAIADIIKEKNINTYKRLQKMCKEPKKAKKEKEIKLGDSIENLMRSDSYKREGRRIKQRGWG